MYYQSTSTISRQALLQLQAHHGILCIVYSLKQKTYTPSVVEIVEHDIAPYCKPSLFEISDAVNRCVFANICGRDAVLVRAQSKASRRFILG